jgi:RNA polymerase sigma factor (sigma-70 family)
MSKINFRTDVLPLKDQLFRLALRITLNRAEAEDVVQETMIKVWNNREKWEEIESIEAYCFTITRNLAIDSTRKQSNKLISLDESQSEKPDRTSNPYEDINAKDRLNTVKCLINNLPEKQKSCLQLRDFEGKAYKEIAGILGITEDQVKINIFRARQAIKQRYQEFDKYGL